MDQEHGEGQQAVYDQAYGCRLHENVGELHKFRQPDHTGECGRGVGCLVGTSTTQTNL